MKGLLLLAAWIPGVLMAQDVRPIAISKPDWPPFYIEGDRPVGKRGLATEILTRCAEQLNLQYRYLDYPINRMFKAMEKGELDVNIMSFKPERTKFLLYGKEPAFRNSYVPFVRRGSTITVHSLGDFDKLFVGDFVGVRTSDEYRAYLDKRLASPSGNVDVVNAPDSLVKMLVKGRIDITVAAKAELPWRAEAMGYPPNAIKALPFVLKSADYFIVVAKASPLLIRHPTLMGDFDKCLAHMKKDGTYFHLLQDNNIAE